MATLSPTHTPVATPTPSPSVLQQPQWEIRQELSEGMLHVWASDGVSADPYVIAAADPELAVWEQWEIAFATDTDGDGRQEAVVIHYTGGAHCCSEYLILSSGVDGISLDDKFSLGNAGIGDIQDLDGDSVPELIGFDDRLAYFTDLSYAVSPFLPLVLCRSTQGSYYDCTPQFPDSLIENAGVYEELLREAVQGQASQEEQRAAALGLYFSYLRLGMGEDGERIVTDLCPACWQWLSQNGPETSERLNWEQPWRE